MPHKDREARNAWAKKRYYERKAEDPEWQKRKNEQARARAAEDPNLVEKKRARCRAWYSRYGTEYNRKNGVKSADEYLAECEAKTLQTAVGLGVDASDLTTPEGIRAFKNAYMRKWSQTEAGKRSNVARAMKRRCDATIDEYDAAYEAQQGRCRICKQSFPKYDKGRMVVDHCHATGRFRALLCDRCNHTIGHARENISILQSAIAYLKAEQQEALDLSPP